MRFEIKHEIKGRIRVHMAQPKMTYAQADVLQYVMEHTPGVRSAKVYERTADAAITYDGSREAVLEALRAFSYEKASVPEGVIESSGRELNAQYQEKLLGKILWRACSRFVLPAAIGNALSVVKSVRYLAAGARCLARGRLEVPVLDAAAIGVSIVRKDYNTAGSVMFLLGIGELLEEWTHKKSVHDLARSMALNVGKVWTLRGGQEILVDSMDVAVGDTVLIRMGSPIPFDGVVQAGEAMVNQASLTGESTPVKKAAGKYVYAGTVVEEGEIAIEVREVSGSTRYEKIIRMIEDSEKLKSSVESRAAHLADRLVPYTFLATGLTYLFTRNVTRALSALMVDFSCALKLAMPLTVLSAIREASSYRATVKGGKYLEALAEATTIVFDKTGTLTKAQPSVVEVISFCGQSEEELLTVAACLEEHFPHSMAKAVVRAAEARGLLHEEMHSHVDYIVAHGIASYIEEKRVIIGSYHFVFEDEGCVCAPEDEGRFAGLPKEYSHLYMAVDGRLAAVILIEDPVRGEAASVVAALRRAGFGNIVMMTGDNEHTAASIAAKLGVDEYHAEVLPEDKARFVTEEKKKGRFVVMVGDGINDSPALSAADVGIAISDGAAIAREIADITVEGERLDALLVLRALSEAMMRRINSNYKAIMGINGTLIALGVLGLMQPTTSALLHNVSTLCISVHSMKNLLV